MSHFHKCNSKLLKRRNHFTITTILDVLMVRKGSQTAECHTETQIHLLGDINSLSLFFMVIICRKCSSKTTGDILKQGRKLCLLNKFICFTSN